MFRVVIYTNYKNVLSDYFLFLGNLFFAYWLLCMLSSYLSFYFISILKAEDRFTNVGKITTT